MKRWDLFLMGTLCLWANTAMSSTPATAHVSSANHPQCCTARSDRSATSPADLEQALFCVTLSRPLVIVGEIHGSNETPALVFGLLRKVLAVRSVRLGLEIPVTEQASIETYLHSQGTLADQAKLLTGAFWNQMRDGRSSKAMLLLIDGVRVLKVAGADVDIFTMEPDYARQMDAIKREGVAAVKESGMTQSIRAVLAQGTAAQVIALMGNFHARDARVDLFKGSPQGSVTERLTASRPYVLLPFSREGATWTCTEKGCGIHPAGSQSAPTGSLPMLISNLSVASGPTVVTVWLPSFSASQPAKAEALQ